MKVINKTTIEIDGINYTNFDEKIVETFIEMQLYIEDLKKGIKTLIKTNQDYFERLSNSIEYIEQQKLQYGIKYDKLEKIIKGRSEKE